MPASYLVLPHTGVAPDSFFCEAIGIKSRFAVITDHQVFKTLVYACLGHVFNSMQPIAPVTMTMNNTLLYLKTESAEAVRLCGFLNNGGIFT